jgi:hypothetical protein
LQLTLDVAKQQIVEHCLPNLLKNLTPALRGGDLNGSEEYASAWLEQILNKDFPYRDNFQNLRLSGKGINE